MNYRNLTNKEIKKKYHLDESHKAWESGDDWDSVELTRIVLGRLPKQHYESFDEARMEAQEVAIKFIEDFEGVKTKMMEEDGMKFGHYYIIAKRMLCQATLLNQSED